MRNIDGAGADHMLMVGVGEEPLAPTAHVGRRELAVVAGDREHLASGGFDGPRLVDVDVAVVGAQDARIGRGDRIEDVLVGLGAPDQEPYVRVGCTAGLANPVFRARAVVVRTVAGQLLHVGFREASQNGRVSAFAVIVDE